MSIFWRKFLHSGLIAGAKLGSAFVLAKLLAVYGGAGGFALFSQYQNIVQIGSGLAGCGAGQGLVRFLAEPGTRRRRRYLIAAAFWLGILLSLSVGLVTMLGLGLGRTHIFQSQWSFWMVVTVITLVLVAVQHVALSALNGLGATHVMAWLTIVAALTTIMLAWLGFIRWGTLGGTLGVVGGTVLMIGLAFGWLYGRGWLPGLVGLGWRRLWLMWRLMFRYVGMAMVATLAMPMALIFVRSVLGAHDGWNVAGEWSALWRLSDAYLLVFVTLLNIYLVPRLAAAEDRAAAVRKVRHALVRFVPMVVCAAIVFFVLRKWVVLVALSGEFIHVTAWMPGQLIGDVLKMVAWILAQYLWVRGEVKGFVLSELMSAGLFAAVSSGLIYLGWGAMACVLAFMGVSALTVLFNGWMVWCDTKVRL